MKKIFTDIFIKFNNGEYTNEMLITELRKIEEIISSKRINKLKTIWFKFFDDDPLATSIDEIESDLKSVTNREFIKNCIKISVETDSLIVNFS